MSQADAPCRLLITAGPTQEPIDAVRFIGNRSSGRMGIALAAAAIERGWATTLLLGPTPLDPPAPRAGAAGSIRVERYRTAADLRAALARHWPHHDVLVMAAAVADYRPAPTAGADADTKLKRTGARLHLELEPTEDLVAEAAAAARTDQVVIGFALEPAATLEAEARRKLVAKGLDAIVANPLDTMDSDRISASLHTASGETFVPPADMTKADFATWLLDRLAAMRERGAS